MRRQCIWRHFDLPATKSYMHYLVQYLQQFSKKAGLPWWLRQERICLQRGKPGFNPWVRKIPWRRKWLPIPVFLPGEFHGQRGLVGYSPWGCKDSNRIEWLTLSFSLYKKAVIQRKKLRLREVEKLPQGHTSKVGRIKILMSLISDIIPLTTSVYCLLIEKCIADLGMNMTGSQGLLVGVNGEVGRIGQDKRVMLRSLNNILLVVGTIKGFWIKKKPRSWIAFFKRLVFKGFVSCVTTVFPAISSEGILLFPQGQKKAYKGRNSGRWSTALGTKFDAVHSWAYKE